MQLGQHFIQLGGEEQEGMSAYDIREGFNVSHTPSMRKHCQAYLSITYTHFVHLVNSSSSFWTIVSWGDISNLLGRSEGPSLNAYLCHNACHYRLT